MSAPRRGCNERMGPVGAACGVAGGCERRVAVRVRATRTVSAASSVRDSRLRMSKRNGCSEEQRSGGMTGLQCASAGRLELFDSPLAAQSQPQPSLDAHRRQRRRCHQHTRCRGIRTNTHSSDKDTAVALTLRDEKRNEGKGTVVQRRNGRLPSACTHRTDVTPAILFSHILSCCPFFDSPSE
jgi:hypothetical protein